MKDQPDRTFHYPDQCKWEEQLRAMEQRARTAEARYEHLVNRLPAVITMAAVDDQASTLYQSPYMETMLGYSPQEWLDDPNMLEKVLHPDDRAWVMALNRETNTSGQPFRAEYRVIARDGRIVWINDEEVQVHDGDGVHWHGIMMDVSERKQTEERMREAQARYRTLVEQLPAVTYIDPWNEDGLTYISPQIESLLGYPAGDWISNPTLWQERIHPEDRARMIQADRDTDATGNNLEAEYRMIAADESVVWVRDQANLVRASDGTPLYWHGIMMDITRQCNAEGRVLEEQNRFQTLVEQMPAGVYLESIGDQKHMLYVSPQIEKVLGYQTQQWLSIPNFWDTVIHPDDRDWVAAADRNADVHGTRFHHEYRAVAADGRTVWLRDESVLIRNAEGEPLHWQGVLVDVTDSKVAETALTHQATHDALTNLPNRALLHDRVQQAVLQSRRHNQHLALLLLDLNRFKEVNDTLGHHMGDMLLKQIGYRLCDAVRESDTVARLGGDEFAILLPETDHAGAATIAKKIRAVLDAPFGLEGHVFDVGASIGCAVYPNHGEDVSTLLRRADVAMYVAKRHGRDFVVYVEEDDRNNATRLVLVRELRSAIEDHELSLHYQPLVDPQRDNVRRVEALARWPHPARDMVPPSLFVPLAEETGLIRPLTHWALGTAAKQAHMWRNQGIDLAIAVNISARSLHDPELVSVVAGLLDRYEVLPASLAIEITESAIIVDPEHAHRTLTELHDMGLPIAIDDFGTGYSSLAHLKRLPIDEIKIDRAFVGDMVTNADNAFIVRSIIDLAHNLDMQIVAEGVENQATLEMLLDMGCDLIQGYYISPPVAANALHSWLDHQERKIG